MKITVDLEDRIHQALVRWTAQRAPHIGAPMMSLDEIVTAMIITTCRYADVADTVCSQIRHQRATKEQP